MSDDFWRDLAPQAGETARDPREAARAATTHELPKRFYACASAEPRDGGFALVLDGRGAKTPGKNPLVAPTREAGEALASEWEAQGERIDPATMPLTRILNSAIDGVAAQMAPVAEEIVRYAASDLVCYRAGDPESLVLAEAAAWDPVLVFARERYGARFLLAEGVMFVEQPAEAIASVRTRVLRDTSPVALAALNVMTTLSGSALIALAVADARITPAAGWEAAHVDELHQERVWGEDTLATARRAAREREFEAAALLYRHAV